MELKFYKCPTCGNVIVKLVDSGITPSCCGKPMVELTPNTVEASEEKHLPVIERTDECTIRVSVGSEPHPQVKEHHISLIAIAAGNSLQVKWLKVDNGKPTAEFRCKCKVDAAYALCNLHGLWLTKKEDCKL